MNIKLKDIRIDYEMDQDFMEVGLPWVATYENVSVHFRHKPTKHQAKVAIENKQKLEENFNKVFENAINSIAYKIYHTDSRKNLSNIPMLINKPKEEQR